MTALILGAAGRVRRDGLEVVPDEGGRAFEVAGDVLRVPGFSRLGGGLLPAAVTGGVEDAEVSAYLDSILEFAGAGDDRLSELRRNRSTAGVYPTTEADILREHAPENGGLSEDEGLRIVLNACDELEAQVSGLSEPREGASADVS